MQEGISTFKLFLFITEDFSDTVQKIARKIHYFNPILWKCCFVKYNKIHCLPFCFANSHKIGCLNVTDGGSIFILKQNSFKIDYFIPIFEMRFSMNHTAAKIISLQSKINAK